jgi:vitamin B12 transporter
VSFDLVGKREDLDYLSYPSRPVTLSPYVLLKAILSYDLTAHLQVYGQLDNILGQKYEMVYGYGTVGFSIQAGMKISL